MPRDGSMILSDLGGPTLAIVCEPCGRRERYNVEWLMAEHGDTKLTDLLGDTHQPRQGTFDERPRPLQGAATAVVARAVYEGL